MAARRSRWSQRATLVTSVGVVVIVALDAARAAPPARTDARPNVVVVLVDDMGWSDIGPYGGDIPTPNLDALAARGVRFTQFYATPRCSPISPPAVPISSGRLPQHGPGPREPTWTRGRGHRGSPGATTRRR